MQLNYSQTISYICKNECDYFLNKPNVIGVGRGYKVKNGLYTNENCIVVLVVRKVPSNTLCYNDLIPRIYKGIPTDIYETGPIEFQSLTQKIRPTACGYSIGPFCRKLINLNIQNPEIQDTTTLGCLVTNDKDEFILTTNHGIVNGTLKEPIDVVQPSILDGGKYPKDYVGYVAKWINLEDQGTFYKPKNLVDVCLIKIANLSETTPIIYHVGIPSGAQLPELNEEVLKVGRTTELTFGKITVLDSTVTIKKSSKTYVFEDQIITTSMSESGDCGAVLMNNSKFILGMNIAGGKSCSVFNNIKNILKLLKVKIVIK